MSAAEVALTVTLPPREPLGLPKHRWRTHIDVSGGCMSAEDKTGNPCLHGTHSTQKRTGECAPRRTVVQRARPRVTSRSLLPPQKAGRRRTVGSKTRKIRLPCGSSARRSTWPLYAPLPLYVRFLLVSALHFLVTRAYFVNTFSQQVVGVTLLNNRPLQFSQVLMPRPISWKAHEEWALSCTLTVISSIFLHGNPRHSGPHERNLKR